MTTKAVIGLGFGDEGKGVVTEYLCAQNPKNTLVVRFSGGQQAGHKVMKGDISHIFSNFGSGTLSDCPTYWSEYCTFEPVGFMTEWKKLEAKGHQPRFFIHPNTPVTTPYDIYANQEGIEKEHGTCGYGVFKTRNRHYKDGPPFSFDFLSSKNLEELLNSVAEYYNFRASTESIGDFLKAAKEIQDLLKKNAILEITSLSGFHSEDIVFEGSQGLLLHETVGWMPHCTPSDLTPKNIKHLLGHHPDEIYLVSRVYQTRHGNGPMTNTHLPVALTHNQEELNVTNAFQGQFRTSVLDAELLKRAMKLGINPYCDTRVKKNLVLTCADQMFPYKITIRGQKLAFDAIENFAAVVAEVLQINGDIYINDSPYSTTVRKI